MFSAEFYTNNRQSLMAALPKNTVVVIAGHEALQMSADITYPFRQDSNMLYLCSVAEPEAFLVLSADQSILIVAKRSAKTQLWDGQHSLEQLQADSGVDQVVSDWKLAKQLLAKSKSVGILEPIKDLPWGGTPNPARAKLKRRVKRYLTTQPLVDIRPQMAELRMVKQPEEIAALERAVEITAEGYFAVQRALPSLTHEFELQAVFTSVFQAEKSDHAYEPIIASGRRSCTLHYKDNSQEIEDNLVLFDVAAKFDGYHADVSRTMSHKKSFSPRQQAVYDAVLKAQVATINEIGPGMTFREIDDVIRKHIAVGLVELGLSKKPSRKDTIKYLPHSSHFLGLDVHDAGDYSAVLPENTVITIEPGIYLPDEGIGVRIEDMVVLKKAGNYNMTEAIPK